MRRRKASKEVGEQPTPTTRLLQPLIRSQSASPAIHLIALVPLLLLNALHPDRRRSKRRRRGMRTLSGVATALRPTAPVALLRCPPRPAGRSLRRPRRLRPPLHSVDRGRAPVSPSTASSQQSTPGALSSRHLPPRRPPPLPLPLVRLCFALRVGLSQSVCLCLCVRSTPPPPLRLAWVVAVQLRRCCV